MKNLDTSNYFPYGKWEEQDCALPVFYMIQCCTLEIACQ